MTCRQYLCVVFCESMLRFLLKVSGESVLLFSFERNLSFQFNFSGGVKHPLGGGISDLKRTGVLIVPFRSSVKMRFWCLSGSVGGTSAGARYRFLSYSRRRSNKRAKEHSWSPKKIGEKWEGGEREGGGGGEKRNPSLAPPLPLLHTFRTLPQFRFPRVSFSSHSLPVSFPLRTFLETPATQARIGTS